MTFCKKYTVHAFIFHTWETIQGSFHFIFFGVVSDLWNDGDSGAELMEAQLSNVHPINEDVALSSLNDSKESQR